MAQVESGPGRGDPAAILTVASNVKHVGGAVPNPPALAAVTAAESHPGVSKKFF